eukprot:TRINITY_DN28656_c0_g1_i3.p1 TRINITY_DN28656_c0_g1~~TRINITY_DN28656_c0_g1_i3.p1  ORF type:complete len:364 (+),score=43.43 TRINITY_DN28656_c0_g1_i3:58-1149(+)
MYPSSGRGRGGYEGGRGGSSYRGRHPSSSYSHYGGRYGAEYPPRPPPERDQYEYKQRGPPSDSYYERGGGEWRESEGSGGSSRYRGEYSYRGRSYPPRGRGSYNPMTSHYRGSPYHRGYSSYRGSRGMRGRGRYEPRGYRGSGRGRGDSGYYNPYHSHSYPQPSYDRVRFQYRREDDLIKEKRGYEEDQGSPRGYYGGEYKRARRASPDYREERRRSSTPVNDRLDWLDDESWVEERRRNWPSERNILRKTRYQSQENDDREIQVERWTDQLLAVLKVQKDKGIAQQAGTFELVQRRHRIDELLGYIKGCGASNWSMKEKDVLLQSLRFLCINNFFKDIGTTPIEYNLDIPDVQEEYDHEKLQ